MTDQMLAEALSTVSEIERTAKSYLAGLPASDLAERDAAQIASRQATALRKPLETWLATRSMRAQLQRT